NVQLAEGQLQNAGFTNISVVHVSAPGVQDGTVVQQSPHAGHTVSLATQITLTVAKTQPTTPPASPTPTQTSIFPTPTPTPTSPTPTP
ncbi:MAG: PASTA domain-containing protein, partial [Actinobacteria bacterium]|nr:PASTA domain-containing protein [Actinomycetota bacterium]